ncbi:MULTISPECIES: hypothetical protein [Nostocales]|uniref:hypothetical protein n=1 Tax=Nostocales TaxID=1161 RepID=UPI00030B1B55|nr:MULTISPECIES: hypothetical protein [Nostocales]MBO1054136.1 hypothetical protein [Dolichospermum sp. DET73]
MFQIIINRTITGVRSQESGVRSSEVWLTPRFAIRSMANATLRYQEFKNEE